MDYADHPPKPQMVLPCLLRAQTTSMAVTVFLLACSVQVTASLTIPSRKPLRTCLESSQMKEEILLTPPLLASLRMAGLVMPSMLALACLFWAVLLVPTLPLPPTPLPPLPCPAIQFLKYRNKLYLQVSNLNSAISQFQQSFNLIGSHISNQIIQIQINILNLLFLREFQSLLSIGSVLQQNMVSAFVFEHFDCTGLRRRRRAYWRACWLDGVLLSQSAKLEPLGIQILDGALVSHCSYIIKLLRIAKNTNGPKWRLIKKVRLLIKRGYLLRAKAMVKMCYSSLLYLLTKIIISTEQVYPYPSVHLHIPNGELLAIIMIAQSKEFVNNRSGYNNYFAMQLRQLFANVLNNPKELRVESKEEFFSTRHKQRKMKKSTCFSEQIEVDQNFHSPLQKSITSVQTDGPLSGCCKELQSTFGEEGRLAFRAKPPKRKRNLRMCHDRQKRQESSSQSDSESSTKNSMILGQKTPEMFKPQVGFFQKPYTAASSFKVSDFYILGKIGEGSYSEVYKAIEKRSGFVCALKVLEKWKMSELCVQQNVIREIKLNMYLSHPNIAKLYACFHDQHHIYLVCQYATNNNLYEMIKQPKGSKKETSVEKVTKIVGQICEAVRFIHHNSVIHRDVKPENILLTMGNTVKICDFGWSIYNPNKEMRLTLCGTPLYLAPQMVAQISYDQSIDIWAIGVITYELLTEESPFQITQLRDLSKIIHQDIKLDVIYNQHAADFIKHAMQKNPSHRKCIFELCRHPFISSFFQSNQNL